jgi:hypothetical protein
MASPVSQLTRRSALALLAAAPTAAFAARRRPGAAGPRRGAFVDVSALRRNGDNTDADYFAEVLPRYLEQQFGPGHSVDARIDGVYYGPAGSSGGGFNNRAVDTIEGVGRVDGREIPVQTSLQTFVSLPDIGGYGARQRQDLLAQSFAQTLAQQSGAQSGSWR